VNPAELPFDADAILDGLRTWVECESPTYDAASVNRMMDIASRELAIAGARIERVAGRMGYGDCVRASFPHATPNVPGILVMGHLDTVHPIGTLDRLPFRRDGGRAWGPGIQDMKGGNYMALEAIRQLARANVPTGLPVTVLLTSDEEVGSPSTRDLIEAEASRHRYVLVPEPARADGGVVTGRYAIARFNLEATGRPSHAGARLAEGRSAIRQWVNCVTTTCTGEALSMAKRQEDLDRGVARMLALSASSNDAQFKVTRGVTRPVWEPNGKVMALYDTARGIARGLGYDISSQSSGGGSDGNFTGAMGVATLDGLGVQGAGAHTLDEHIVVESLAYRGRLMAGLFAALG
jgi:glutamate carboxypeptidase